MPMKTVKTATQSQRSLLRRSKNSERNIAKRMAEIDGEDDNYKKIASKNGRVGFITNIRVDSFSKNYAVENKNRVLPQWLIDAWILILQRSDDFNKHPMLHLDPPNMPKEYPINGVLKKTDTMAVITQTRHEELILKEKELEEILRSAQDETIR